MIEFKKRSMFRSKVQTLVNPVNCVGVMGAGLALRMKQEFPDMFDSYKKVCTQKLLEPGKLHLYKDQGRWILNFPTKKHYRDPSTMEYIELGLDKFVETYKEKGITSIAFPKIGSGLGGLDWLKVKELMISKLSDLDILVEIYE